jgi:hypothetical protein
VTFDTRRGKVIAALAERVRAMTTAAGYHWTVKPTSVRVDPENILLVPEPELPAFQVEISPANAREFLPANELEDTFRVLITGRAVASGLAPNRKTVAGENLIGDLERVLAEDITLGGRLFDLRIVAADPVLAGFGTDNNVIVMVEVECSLHRQHGQP